jgi:hypothetical protein
MIRKRLFSENVVVIALALAICVIVLVFPEIGRMLKHGVGFGLAALLMIKGTSRLRCQKSDVLLTTGVFISILLSKTLPDNRAVFVSEICALALVVSFAFTGLTFESIARDQRTSRRLERQ